MGRSVTVSLTDYDGNVNTYTITSDYNFLVVYTHYTFITSTEAVEDAAFIYSGNTSIPFTISDPDGSAKQSETALWLDQKSYQVQLYYGMFTPDKVPDALANSGFDHVFTGKTYEDGYQYVGIYDMFSQLPDDLNGGGSGGGDTGGGDNGDTGSDPEDGSGSGGESGGDTGGTGGGDTTNRMGLSRALALSAYWLGRRIAGQRRKPPVAWLYNGIPLPVGPVYDKKLYSYALITRNDNNSYDFVVMAQPCFFNNDEGEVQVLVHDDTSTAGQTYEATVDSPNKFTLSANNPYFGFSYDYVVWTNFDLYDSTGKLHTAASEPAPCYSVPEEKFATYNGIVAPVLSGYDHQKYPYAVMVKNDDGVRVFISTTPILFNYYFTSSKSGMRLYCKNNGTIARLIKGCWDNRWEYYKETEESGDAGTSFLSSFAKLVWANHDIYFVTDETSLYMAASEPIPIYE